MVKKLFPNMLFVVSELKAIFKGRSLYLNVARIKKKKPVVSFYIFRGSKKIELLQ